MSKHIEVSSSSGKVSLPVNSAIKAEHLIKSQSVYFGHMQSTSLLAASDGPADIDEVNPAGLEKTVATDIGSAVSVLDLSDPELHSVQLDLFGLNVFRRNWMLYRLS